MLYLFIKSFVNPYVDVSLTFTDISFNSFWTGICTVLFKVAILFRFISYHQNFFFFTRSTISLLLAKFASFNFATKLCAINFLCHDYDQVFSFQYRKFLCYSQLFKLNYSSISSLFNYFILLHQLAYLIPLE